MKRALLLSICFALLLMTPAALAAKEDEESVALTPTPTLTPAPTSTPASPAVTPFPGLIGISSMENATNEDVLRVQIRLRDLGYFNFKPTGVFQSMTADAAKKFQQKHTMDDGSPMIADGTIGSQSMDILFRHSVARADIAADIPFGKSLEGEPAVTGELAPWSEVKPLLQVGTAYTITDYNTGSTFIMAFTGGESHAEMECTDAFNASLYKAAFGGEYNYSKRPVVVSISGRQIAASLSGWPHDSDQYTANEMGGHACLFFDGSLSHVGNLPDAEHQELVYKAAGRG
jgi:peptidoglycan hydrolase-like protein with peptidoglycan-binding domain